MKKGLNIIKHMDNHLKTDLGRLQGNISKYSHFYDIPIDLIFNNVEMDSWFDIQKAINNNFDRKSNTTYDDIEHDKFYTKSYKLDLTDMQKRLIDRWIDFYTLMYNGTIKHINYRSTHGLPFLNVGKMKKALQNIKQTLMMQSEMTLKINKKDQVIYKKVYINSHTLDYAINDAIQRFKSSLTNLKRKNIKHFRLRLIKLTKKERIMKLEKSAFGKNTICGSILGEVKCLNNEDNFSYLTNMSTVSIIKKYGNEYYLLKKYKFEEDIIDDDRVIGLDPGIRTVLTGYANKDILEIGNKVSEIIKKKLKQIDSIIKKGFNKKKERAIVKRKYERIKNMTKDMHHKVSNYLTENYGNIIMGNLSTKSVGEGKGIARMTKRIGNMISFNKFKKILKYKCVRKGVNYKEMDERYTTKCCGKCGNKKENLGGNKIYNCERCGIKMGRDINSARLMIIKSEQ